MQEIMSTVEDNQGMLLEENDMMLFDDRPYIPNPLIDETEEDGHTKTLVYTIEDSDVDCSLELMDVDNLKLELVPEAEPTTSPETVPVTEPAETVTEPAVAVTEPAEAVTEVAGTVAEVVWAVVEVPEAVAKPIAVATPVAVAELEPRSKCDYTTTDPVLLLKALSPMLGNDGDIKDVAQIAAITKLMKASTKLVSKCVYSNILRATTNVVILNAFIAEGGWDILNDWLQEARKDVNDGFLRELLKVYGQIPITVSLLKQNSCAKTIKQISKSDNAVLKKMSAQIVDRWMSTVRQASGDSSSDKSKKKKHHHRDSKDKDSKENGQRSQSKSSPEYKSRSSPERDATPFINGTTTSLKTEPNKPRAKTVKAVPTKFRSTGLEQETVLPQVRKKDHKEISKSLAAKRPSIQILKSTPPEKKARPALPSPLPSTTATTHVEKKGGIKLIPARPKPVVQVYESAGFMDALTTTSQATAASMRRKRRGSGASKPPTPTSPPGSKQPSVPSFYQDTMEDDKESSASQENAEVREDKDSTTSNAGGDDDAQVEVESAGQVPGEPAPPKKKKKKVTWVSDAELTRFFYFEMDDTERVNVNKVKDFASSIKQEMEMERQLHESAKRSHSGQELTSGINWRRPQPISGLPHTVIRGCNSTEKDTQKQREQGVLQALFFSKSMIPDSPVEPEPEAYEPVDPKNIPLEDETGSSASETVFSEYPKPVNMADIPAKSSSSLHDLSTSTSSAGLTLHPELANLVASMAQQSQLVGGDQQIPNGSYNTPQQPPQYSQAMVPPPQGGQSPMGMAPPGYYGPPPGGLPPNGPGQMMHNLAPPHNMPPPGYIGQHGPPPPRYDGMPGMRPPDEEWGENMHGGPMMGPRNNQRGHHMPYRRGDHRGPPRGQPPRGRNGRGGRPTPVCRNFMSGGCRFEKACSYLHPGVNAPPL